MVAAKWLPDRYTLFDLSVYRPSDRTVFSALFKDDAGELIIQIVVQTDPFMHNYERDDTEIELYNRNGIDHYIMTNNGKTNVIWITGNYECSIGGDITAGEAAKIVDSIYER